MRMKAHEKMAFASVLAAAAVGFGGCATPLCELRDPASGQTIPSEFLGTTAKLEREIALPAPVTRPVTLQKVETVSCGGYDRVIFTFDRAVPSYTVQYIDRPIRECGSGNVVSVAGDAWLEVRFAPAQAHTESGVATVSQRNRTLNYANLRQLVSTCDFESHVNWVLGVGKPGRFRATELNNPPRLVLDVRH
jgi:hypothetical protein